MGKGSFIYYIAGAGFLILAFYKLTVPIYLDFILYASLGIAFLLTAFIRDEKFNEQKQLMVILSWVFILIGLLAFIYSFNTPYIF